MKNLSFGRPVAFFDLETTGTDPASDRIVEIAVLRMLPGGERESRTRRIHPERPIPPEATAVHGIRDEDVRESPVFRQIARGLLDFLGDADLAGFGVLRFDVPLLDREFRDCGLDLGLAQRRILDMMTIYHRKESRDLSAAVRFYLGREHQGAHSAVADVEATAELFDAQLARYTDLPREVAALEQWLKPPVPPDAVDRAGKFVWRNGEVVFSFGRYSGKSLREIAREQKDYLDWILRTDFPPDAREMVLAALRGEFPVPPVR